MPGMDAIDANRRRRRRRCRDAFRQDEHELEVVWEEFEEHALDETARECPKKDFFFQLTDRLENMHYC